jgi:predicted esterase
MKNILFALVLVCSVSCLATMPKNLPALGLDPNAVTVSGLSSGAFMAVQLGVAYSAQIHGVGSIAGGIYDCAGGQQAVATDLCMKYPERIDENKFVQIVKDLSQKQEIDDVKNLAQQKVYILNGSEDKTVLPVSGQKLESFFKSLGAETHSEFGLKMGHAFPSEKAKNRCEVTQFPWMNRCGFDGAQKVLETFYGPMLPATIKTSGPLTSFDQTEFDSKAAGMGDAGHVFIPASCKVPGSQCRLHIALHGCMQSPTIVQNAFNEGAGFNEWADANKIVVLYPTANMSGQGNPNGCWDWFGYTGANYVKKSAVQMTAIMKMVGRLETAP